MNALPLLVVSFLVTQEPPADPFAKWEKEIAGIEKKLKDKPPAKESIFFVGSSSIKLWDVKKSFPDLPVVNVGFGGSVIKDSTHFVDRIIAPFEPKSIVFYAGDNDIASKRTPEQVQSDFADFVKAVRAKLPKVKIYFVAVKPSGKRWEMFDKQKKANELVKVDCEKGDKLVYVDVVGPMLDKEGKPKEDIFKDDKLHMNEKGYEIWTGILVKLLKE